jgi:hypothetical protein
VLRVNDVLYDNRNCVRRQYLLYRFDRTDPAGTLVHVDSNPDGFLGSQSGDGPRLAKRWLDSLGLSAAEWEKERVRSRTVRTQPWPLGAEGTNGLIRHAFAQTVATLLTRELIDAPPSEPVLPTVVTTALRA